MIPLPLVEQKEREMKDRQPDIRTICDVIEKCEECPRYADDCDGKGDTDG